MWASAFRIFFLKSEAAQFGGSPRYATASRSRRALHRFIYEVAESPNEAWEVIEELHEDDIQVIAIVSDWLMPGTKGDEFLIQIHQRFHLVTVMLTGQADEIAIQRAKEQANLHACLYKPWTEQELTQIITTAID